MSDIDQDSVTERRQVAQLEVDLLDPMVRADAQRLDELLHPDFVEHGASGRIWTRQAIINELPLEDETSPRTTASDVVAAHLTEDVMLVTCRTASTFKTAVRSSLWLRSAAGVWQIRFHQGTSVPNGVSRT